MPTVGTSVKLRLPFGVDTELKLLPAPYATDPPPGELWKSRMRLSFVPRTGQSNVGNALVSSSGGIAHKIVNLESMIVRFSNPLAANGFQTLSLTDAGAIGLNIDIKAGSLEVYCDDKYHGIGDNVGPFIVTNQVGMGACTYNWHSEYGTMYPNSGLESDLTVEQLPVFSTEKITVVTTAELDSETCIEVTTSVEKCYKQEFSARLSTDNFSPHLFETNWISVDVPGCEHILSSGWLEIEAERETIGEMQHVAYVDLDPSTPSVDRYLDTSAHGGQTLVIPWDGTAQVSLPLTDHPDMFNGPQSTIHRAMPVVTAGEPVPPPFYMVVVRLWNATKTEVLNEFSKKVFIPQVVHVQWESSGYEAFDTSYLTPGVDQVCIYQRGESPLSAFTDALPGMIQAAFPRTMNIRVTSGAVQGKYKLLTLNDVGTSSDCGVTFLGGKTFFQNVDVDGLCEVRVRNNIKSAFNAYVAMILNQSYPESFDVPLDEDDLMVILARSAAHEIGHTLGLVNPVLGGSQRLHNTPPHSRNEIMLPGSSGFLKWRIAPLSEINWRTVNKDYLEFILPKGPNNETH